jgi:hypothetical protein
VNVPPVGVPVTVMVCCSLAPPSTAAEAVKTADSVIPPRSKPSSGCGSTTRVWRRTTPGMVMPPSGDEVEPEPLAVHLGQQRVGTGLGIVRLGVVLGGRRRVVREPAGLLGERDAAVLVLGEDVDEALDDVAGRARDAGRLLPAVEVL